jgi:hypothetical protein
MSVTTLVRRCTIAVLFVLTTTAHADPIKLQFSECTKDDKPAQRIIVVDLTRAVTAENASQTAFVIGPDDDELHARLNTLLAACPTVDEAAARLFLKALREASLSNRIITRAGDSLTVYAFVIGQLANITIDEKKRKPRIVDELRTLFGMLNTIRSKGVGGPAGAVLTVARAEYTLLVSRATSAVAVVPDTAKLGQPSKPETPIQVAEILTGPAERFSISANVPVNSVKLLEYNTTTRQPVLKETPREFMAGLDWYFGDVLSEPPLLDWRRLGLKGLVRFSKEPLDALGLMAAYRVGSIQIIGGPTWNRQTVKVGLNPDGTDLTKKSYKSSWRVGLGFDLKTASGWLTPKKDEAKK